MGSISTAQKSFRVRLHPGERRVILLIGDALMAALAFFVAIYLWGQQDWIDSYSQLMADRVPPWFYLLPFLWLLLNVEMYDVRRSGRRKETLKGIALAAAFSLTLYLFVFFFTSPKVLPRRSVLTFILASAGLMLTWRMVYIQVFTASEFMRRVLIVGAGRSGTTLVQVFKEIWPPPFYLVGLIDDDPRKCSTCVEGFPVLGGSHDLLEIITQERVTDLIFAITNAMSDDMFQAILQAEEVGAGRADRWSSSARGTPTRASPRRR